KTNAAAVTTDTGASSQEPAYAPLSAAQNSQPGASSASTAANTEQGTAADSTYWSKYDQALPEEAKSIIGQAKNEYAIAQKAGDEAGKKAAYNKAQKARAQYGSYVDDVGDGSGYSYFGEDSWSLQDRNASPEAKKLISQGKYLWSIATTDAERAYANSVAESGRAIDGYSGGSDGAGFTKLGILDREYNDTSQYESQYLNNINSILAEIENSQFNYDHTTDPSYQAYLDAYNRQGSSAAETALAQTAANTGGIASSYAAAVANQARQAYAKKATDMIPQLEQQAYERYANDLNNRFNLAGLYGDLDNSAYDRFADNKNFNFGQWQANYNNAYQQDYDAKQLEWLREQLERTLADTQAERQWQTSENVLDRELQKYLASLS
ncbi:MAG: hypothetical protein Q4C00_01545, partial [Bacillota bacterium]|nr:hypothetical protein [Bacillota bacterium]